MQSNANTKPIGGEDLKILDIIHSLENLRLRLGFFQTIHDIENFKIFSTNGFSIVPISLADLQSERKDFCIKHQKWHKQVEMVQR